MLSISLTFIYLFEQNILIKRLQSNIHTSMFNFIYEGQDGYEPEYQDSKPICHATQPLNAITTGELAGSDSSGLLSQLLQTVFGGTMVLGQVKVKEMVEDGVDVTNDMSLMEKADATTCTETDESLAGFPFSSQQTLRGISLAITCHFR